MCSWWSDVSLFITVNNMSNAMNSSPYKHRDPPLQVSGLICFWKSCWLPSIAHLHSFKSISVFNDQIEFEMVHCSMWKSQPDPPSKLRSSRVGLFDRPADYSACRAWLELDSTSFPHNLNIFAWPFTLALQTSVEFYKCIPPAFYALISASDRRNVKHKRQYHLRLWEWSSSGSQKMDENIRAHHVLL